MVDTLPSPAERADSFTCRASWLRELARWIFNSAGEAGALLAKHEAIGEDVAVGVETHIREIQAVAGQILSAVDF